MSVKGLAHLLVRFPELRMLMTGGEIQAEQLMEIGGDAVAAIIAAGCGCPGDEAAEAIAGISRSPPRPTFLRPSCG